MMKKLLFLLLTFLCVVPVFAAGDTVYVKGRVVDAKTAKGIPFVTVFSRNGRVCTSSNENGVYKLMIPTGEVDSIIFSVFGYNRDTVSVRRLRRRPNRKLKAGGITLREVSISSYSPRKLREEVVRRIPENYQTDTTVNRYFQRYCRMANDTVYLFVENLLESLRVGYDKFLKKRWISLNNNKRHLNSNYNTLLQSHLWVYDTSYLYNLLRSESRVENEISYWDNYAIVDPVEVPQSYQVLSKRGWRRYKFTLSESDDTVDNAYYVLTMTDLKGIWEYELIIEKKTLAVIVIDIKQTVKSGEWSKPDQRYEPYSSFASNEIHNVIRYEKINGKYTLVSENFYSDIIYTCHNQGQWCDAPTVQHFRVWQSLQLISQRPGDYRYFDSMDVQEASPISFTEIQRDDDEYSEEFWKNINIIPLSSEMEAILGNRRKHPNLESGYEDEAATPDSFESSVVAPQ